MFFIDGSFARDIDFPFVIGNCEFSRLWLMVDGIYPELARFVKTIQEPVGQRKTRYAAWQEACRKDIERAFGVLQCKFHILTKKNEQWYLKDIAAIVYTCILLHNMMVATRIENDEREDENFYLLSSDSTSDDESIIEPDDPEQEYVDRCHAEMTFHRQLFATNNTGNERTRQQQEELDMIRFDYAQHRWECLYDHVEHERLRNACMDELTEN